MKLSVTLALVMAIASAYAAPVMDANIMKSEHHGTSARKGDYLIYIPPADDDEDYGKIARRETPATDAGANTYYGFYVPAAEDDEDYGNDVQNA
ncbi:hypothetical protein H112_00660 [Trichophyton rubrum D6]|uniref:Uncharacterized protein n=3 Tax=Trichophyton rubrum TaxID=5551 RepID=A0A178F6Z6_TRIRU|nr:uncharacterized protein TERG_08954 [Trichophyton rubrum CBS 118892]EZF27371.1 hypothetical protein H100_00660 [Trichophyton rubrum MR850]EZF46413.1 hypothetical protein H102_00657 [Trichophyton rubrum CBS 100081]EZF57035.1 hypothetical protein H103_00659 [Trichophyton rubrum CBS 288.86]EZF67668.1 hypothetical protein H104_00646 [Trichophyton rubrum CBS 289.86]EZF88968.1 hypothetical protein H110_00664 [Trichophyton rubrum MR1448]EZF99773.1 hypothetical protein H113_00663 [Trichophyton rubr